MNLINISATMRRSKLLVPSREERLKFQQFLNVISLTMHLFDVMQVIRVHFTH